MSSVLVCSYKYPVFREKMKYERNSVHVIAAFSEQLKFIVYQQSK